MQNTTLLSKVDALVKQYKGIEGWYASTLIFGVAHYMLDSGIHSDSWSMADADKVEQRVGWESEQSDDELDDWYEAVHAMDDLDCNKLLNAVWLLAHEYEDGSVDSTGCSYLADDIVRYMHEQED
jgi:hypothetical protein